MSDYRKRAAELSARAVKGDKEAAGEYLKLMAEARACRRSILDRTYDGESMVDIDRDVSEALDDLSLPPDGVIEVEISWVGPKE